MRRWIGAAGVNTVITPPFDGWVPGLYFAVLGALKHGCVVCPLFSAFGPEPVDGTLALDTLLAKASDQYIITPTNPGDPALLHFTSGTTGMSYGILAPLAHGITMVVDEGDFDAERWYGVLANEDVTVWYTAPTAVRMMLKGGALAARRYAFPKLRFIASVGEPLNPQAVHWGI